MIRGPGLAGLLLGLLLSACEERGEILADLSPQVSQAQIVAAAGEPATRDVLTKRTAAIWGPEEGFWDRIPLGTELERWTYPVKGGEYRLYFEGGSDGLAYKVFAPEGVVYESR